MFDLFTPSDNSSFYHAISDGLIHYSPQFLKKSEADELFKLFEKEINWKQESMNMYGKKIDFPRLTAWYGDKDRPYSFSGITLQPNEWTEELKDLQHRLNNLCETHFNSLLLNLYRNGKDSISWHQDAEKELGTNPIIASISLGATRRFHLRRKDDYSNKLHFDLGHGSLLIMAGATQHHWQHALLKTNNQLKPRINLTFRTII